MQIINEWIGATPYRDKPNDGILLGDQDDVGTPLDFRQHFGQQALAVGIEERAGQEPAEIHHHDVPIGPHLAEPMG